MAATGTERGWISERNREARDENNDLKHSIPCCIPCCFRVVGGEGHFYGPSGITV